MSYVCNAVTALVLTLLVVSPAWAQSLGDVARKEEARRKTVKAAGKVYTNDTLRKEPEGPPPPTPPSSAPAAAPVPSGSPGQAQGHGGEAQPAAPQPDQKKMDEAYWRGRITEARPNLARSQVFHDALQSRINALTRDFTARDDPAQRAAIELDRQKAIRELDRLKKAIADGKKALADLDEEARRAGVPPGWLR